MISLILLKQIRTVFFILITFNTASVLIARKPNTLPLKDFLLTPEPIIFEENLNELDVITTQTTILLRRIAPKKEVTIMTLMAADNDLAYFARKNLAEQASVGSNDRINIITQLDTKFSGKIKTTKRYYVQKNSLVVMNNNDPTTQAMDSGDPETLISFCKWVILNFPANYYVLIFWNHGTGCIDIGKRRLINSSQFFYYNFFNNMIELNRSIGFLDFYSNLSDERGVCFDDSTGHYLTNQGIEYALSTICKTCLNGQKFGIIGFDACLMAMTEIADIVQPYAEYMTGSQEVEMGYGMDYERVLTPFLTKSLNPAEFAKHIVLSFEQRYSKTTNDYTHSALSLTELTPLKNNINLVASILLECLKKEKNSSVRDALKACRHKLLLTHFYEPSYIDLNHWYLNLLNNLNNFTFNNPTDESLKKTLFTAITQGIQLIKNVVIANTAGKNLNQAKGISIYYPNRTIHNSYRNTNFARNYPQWQAFIAASLLL